MPQDYDLLELARRFSKQALPAATRMGVSNQLLPTPAPTVPPVLQAPVRHTMEPPVSGASNPFARLLNALIPAAGAAELVPGSAEAKALARRSHQVALPASTRMGVSNQLLPTRAPTIPPILQTVMRNPTVPAVAESPQGVIGPNALGRAVSRWWNAPRDPNSLGVLGQNARLGELPGLTAPPPAIDQAMSVDEFDRRLAERFAGARGEAVLGSGVVRNTPAATTALVPTTVTPTGPELPSMTGRFPLPGAVSVNGEDVPRGAVETRRYTAGDIADASNRLNVLPAGVVGDLIAQQTLRAPGVVGYGAQDTQTALSVARREAAARGDFDAIERSYMTPEQRAATDAQRTSVAGKLDSAILKGLNKGIGVNALYKLLAAKGTLDAVPAQYARANATLQAAQLRALTGQNKNALDERKLGIDFLNALSRQTQAGAAASQAKTAAGRLTQEVAEAPSKREVAETDVIGRVLSNLGVQPTAGETTNQFMERAYGVLRQISPGIARTQEYNDQFTPEEIAQRADKRQGLRR